MSRIRSIHPGQWTDQEFVALSAFARLLALAIRNEADDNGIFEWKPLQLKMRLFPGDQVDIAALLAELHEYRHVASYQVNGRRYGIIRNFTRWQKPRRPSTLYPLPEEGSIEAEFVPSQLNAEQELPARDDRQPTLDLIGPAAAETAGRAGITGFQTLSDNVRPEEDEDEDVVQEDSSPVINTESVAAREGEAKNSEGNPFGRGAPLSLERPGCSDNVVGIESGRKRRDDKRGPVITAKIKAQLQAKVCRFAHAALPAPASMEAVMGVWSEDAEEAQRWLDLLDAQMRKADWDDMREWKRSHMEAAR